jgi:hypothetical protein
MMLTGKLNSLQGTSNPVSPEHSIKKPPPPKIDNKIIKGSQSIDEQPEILMIRDKMK